MSNKNEDMFFSLLKDSYAYKTEHPPKNKIEDLYSSFKDKTKVFQQRIKPSEMQKKEIMETVLDNNINHVYNTEILPREQVKLTLLTEPPDIMEIEDIENIEEEEELPRSPSQLSSSPRPTVQWQNSPMRQSSDHLKAYQYQPHKGRQLTLREILENSKRIKKKADNLVEVEFHGENGKMLDEGKGEDMKEMKVTELKLAKPKITEEMIKQQNLEKLKAELRNKNNGAISEKQKQEEIKRQAAAAARLNKQKIENYKARMKENEQQRLAMLTGGGQMLGDNLFNVNQSINKQRRNVDPLIKFLLGYKYHEQKPSAMPLTPVPDEFEDFSQYQQIFQRLILNEYISSISSSLNTMMRQKHSQNYLRCLMKVHFKNEEDEDFTTIELKESNNEEDGEQIVSYRNKNANEIFNLSFANNYLVLITFSKDLVMDQVNNENYKNGFSIVGYISAQEKQNVHSTPKALTIVNSSNLRRVLKKEWTYCYVRPIDKITTFIREYVSLNCFIYSDVNQYVFKPKFVSNVINYDSYGLYERFFDSIKAKYNEGQMEAIKDVCLSMNGICLLQGPPGTGKTHTLVGIVSGIYHYLKRSSGNHRRYIMICAPSNTAIDEIILRIRQKGLFGENQEIIHPNIVRVGILDSDPHELVKNCALENLAQAEMNKSKKVAGQDEKTKNELRDQIAHISKKIEVQKMKGDDDKQALALLYEKRRSLYSQYHDTKMTQVGEKEKYNQIVQNILFSADIICCTLTSAGSEKLDRFRDYIEAVIVDEASQCTEPSNIIPLQYSPKKLILIGDPKQLPATTFSSDSVSTRFNRSLFERIMDSGVSAFFLYEQYRMVSNIRKFPSLCFYDDRLVDAKTIATRPSPQYLSAFADKNVLFVDLKFSKETSADHSYYNNYEINFCTQFLNALLKKITTTNQAKHIIGCISPYKKQVNMLNEKLREANGPSYRNYIAVNTVDAFQGQEKDLVIFSAVRATGTENRSPSDPKNRIGFLSDVRRLNVAITRPKFVLLVVGNSATLATNEVWRNYIQHLVDNNAYINVPEEGEIEKIVRIINRCEKIPSHLTKPPNLPQPTPQKVKKDAPGNYEGKRSADTVSKASTASSATKYPNKIPDKNFNPPPISINGKRTFESFNPDASKSATNEEQKFDKIEKKVKVNPESKKEQTSVGSQFNEGLASLFGGGEKKEQKKTPSPTGGLFSLFSETQDKPKAFQLEDSDVFKKFL